MAPIRTILGIIAAALPFVLPGPACRGEVSRIQIDSRDRVLNGQAFGSAGSYEKITGRIWFELDPSNPANDRIVDLDLSPPNARGQVEAWANFMVLQPTDPGRRAGVGLLEVSNRGGKAALGYFNGADFSRDPTEPADFGDGLLLRHGLTIIWVGWQPDLPDRPGQLRLHVPIATGPDGPIEGLARSDWVIARATDTLALGHRGHEPYPVADPGDPANVLTVRDGRESPRRIIPRDRWRFAQSTSAGVVESRTHVSMPTGFEPGRIYELVYRARDPKVVGIGLAAVRDMIAYAKNDPACPFPVRTGVAFGVSQTGRFLRHFLYQGFNTDEHGHRAFDGMLIHSAGGGRGSFNHRFAQPSRDAHRFSAFFYPTDLFPFSGRTQTDPQTGTTDGLLAHLRRPGNPPRIFYTNTGYEYWGRAAGLIHTTPGGDADAEPLPNERIYHLASGQHFVDRFPPAPERRLGEGEIYRGNPLDFLVLLRALLLDLIQWADASVEPPPSALPHIADATLVPIDRVQYPAIPGFTPARVVHVAYRADYGPDWERGIITNQPPLLGEPFPSLVPQVDRFGNERGGIRLPAVEVPIATYVPWSLRTGLPGPQNELADFRGTYIPLAPTKDARLRAGDPRPSLDELYESRDDYLARVRTAADALVQHRLMLDEDVARVMDHAGRQWDWIRSR